MRIDWDEELDEGLAHRIRRGEDLAFVTLTTRYWPLLRRICSNLLPSAAEANEATGEIFLRALRSSFAPGEPFRTSLLKVAMRYALAGRRSAALPGERPLDAFLPRFDQAGDLTWPQPEGAAPAGMAWEAADLRWRIRKVLRQMPELDHAAFVLREVEGLPIDEVAAILEIPAQNVRQRTHRATLMLTGLLASPGASSSVAS